MDFRLFSSR